MQFARDFFKKRPIWMNAVLLFCAFMTLVYLPYDMFFKPMEEDQEVWFGIVLTGWAAKATEPLHWFIYGAGFYGLLRMKSWMWPWAAVYTAQVAIGMFVWAATDPRGGGPLMGAAVSVPFVALTVAFLMARRRFGQEALAADGGDDDSTDDAPGPGAP